MKWNLTLVKEKEIFLGNEELKVKYLMKEDSVLVFDGIFNKSVS